MKDLLDYIEKAETVDILSQENLISKINILVREEYVEIIDGKLFLTEKGKRARIKEADLPQILEKEKSEIPIFSEKQNKKDRKFFYSCLLLLLVFSLALLTTLEL